MSNTAAALCALLIVLANCLHAQPAPPKPGDLVFATDFASADSRAAWSQNPVAQWVALEGRGQCLQVIVPAEKAAAGNMIGMSLDVKRFQGCRLTFECFAKAQDVTKPPANYLGVKYMCHYVSPGAGQLWRNQDNVFGTFDWKKLQFVVPIAGDVEKVDLSLGLQGSSGSAWFDDVKISVLKPPPPPRPEPPANPGPVFKGHNLPRLRGVMSPNKFRDEDMRVLGQEWKANVIRWQITRNWGQAGTDQDLAEYDKWLNGRLDELDQALVACAKYGIKVVVDMHSPPGGRYEDSDLRIFHEKPFQDHWIALWEQIARRYKGNKAIWGYDLINEPVQNRPPDGGVGDYFDGQVKCATAIRAIDAEMPIFIESAEWDSASAYAEMQPVNLPNIIYQVHMYVPGEFTHQRVFDKNQKPVTYPGMMNGTEWNKERLRHVLQPVRDFQLAYNVHIYCGEFSAARWAPGAAQYLSDCIDLFEEYGWDWTYHAYREWDGWSLEHGPDMEDRTPTTAPTDRRLVVGGWFGKNEKP